MTLAFPGDFTWGAATSAYQIEGGVDLDGRGPSIWDTFCAQPGAIADGSDGRVAADHRRRMRDDVALIAELGIEAYRFSVAWPRVQPTGRGPADQRGLDFYRQLVDTLLEHGVQPVATLYHWDLPQALEDDGGWPARSTAGRFGDYAAIVGEALGDRVTSWSTVNEPWCAAMLGYAAGIHAPGRREPAAAVAAGHHLLLGHGIAVDALRATIDRRATVGITLNPYPVVAAGDGELDRDAARRVDGIANRIWFEPVLDGTYPDDVLADLSAVSDLAHVRQGDLAQISRPIDLVGINYYRRHHVRHRPGASASGPSAQWPGSPDVEVVQPPTELTDGGWAIEPDGLREVLERARADHGEVPLVVHESGAAFDDPAGPGGEVDDQRRIAYLDAHLRAAHRAIEAGVDLRGYFVWSLLDNFEWDQGYTHRFGIVHVDFHTQRRTPKASARWWSERAGTGRLQAR